MPPIIIQTGTRPAGGGLSPRSRRPRADKSHPSRTGTVQTITISRHFAAEQEGEKAQNRPRDKQKYNQLTTSLQTGKGDCATTTTCSGLSLSLIYLFILNSHARLRGVYFPDTSAQINKHCSSRASSRPARPSVRPPPPPFPFHPRLRAPSKLHYPASALRASGPGNNFPKNRKRKREAYAHNPIPARRRSLPLGGSSVCGAFLFLPR